MEVSTDTPLQPQMMDISPVATSWTCGAMTHRTHSNERHNTHEVLQLGTVRFDGDLRLNRIKNANRMFELQHVTRATSTFTVSTMSEGDPTSPALRARSMAAFARRRMGSVAGKEQASATASARANINAPATILWDSDMSAASSEENVRPTFSPYKAGCWSP